jgi:fumarylacetoacetase
MRNPTTDPTLRSWVPTAADSPFPIQNLPYGVFRRPNGTVAVGVAIADHVLDLSALEATGLLRVLPERGVFDAGTLNPFLALGKAVWSDVRAQVSRLLRHDEPTLRDDAPRRTAVLLPQANTVMQLPVTVGDYSDFYSSREHATNVGIMLRGPDNALLPNWLHLPVAYHGRASSIVVSGTPVRRPLGQSKPEKAESPIFGPSRALDFELEVAAVVGPGNALGEPIPVDRAEDHLFGLMLLNDWSARDIQAWEYQPLGPFLSKSFCTSISPWVVTLEALEPFRTAGPTQQPQPLPHLRQDPARSTFDIALEVWLRGPHMTEAQRISRSNFKHLYWSLAQQTAHHASNGCPLRPGDLLASGTVSGPTPDSLGCLLELTWRGSRPLQLGGETRTFLQDGDTVTLTGGCQGDGYRVGFGEVTGTVLPSPT